METYVSDDIKVKCEESIGDVRYDIKLALKALDEI